MLNDRHISRDHGRDSIDTCGIRSHTHFWLDTARMNAKLRKNDLLLQPVSRSLSILACQDKWKPDNSAAYLNERWKVLNLCISIASDCDTYLNKVIASQQWAVSLFQSPESRSYHPALRFVLVTPLDLVRYNGFSHLKLDQWHICCSN